MADHRGGPGVTGTRGMHRGRFVQHHRIPLENPTVTWTQEGGLFLPLGSRKCRSSFLLSPEQPWCYKDKAMVFFLLPLPAVKFISSGTFTKDYF